VLGPYVPLAAKLGHLAMELSNGEVRRISIDVHGELAEYDTRLLTVAALNGVFQGHTDQPVNYVNAPVIAADRGIEVSEGKRRSSRDYTNLVAVTADGITVAGTTIGTDARHFLVSALGFELEMALASRMVLLLYDDIPGVIGRVGTLFGAAGVNIANMTVSRNRAGGKALMALSVDAPPPPELVEQLQQGMDEAYFIL
jgi:D-3-phosphoglycerate dehydrogenase